MSDERDSLGNHGGNHGDAAPAPRAGGAAKLYIPEGETSERAAGNDADSRKGIPAQSETRGETAATRERGGRDGPDPTRFGDWEIKGRCIDF